jgi:adenylate cyclase
MFTDMVGFTASAQSNESGALALLREQEEIVRPVMALHHGREIKSTGDGFLVEFESALHAVQCAIAIQEQLRLRNSRTGVPPIRLRIGVHLGDVEVRGTDIFGDAVNIASRIETFAGSDGICISGQVFDQVRNKIPNELEHLGPQALKNVRHPVDIYRVVISPSAPAALVPKQGPIRLAVLPFASISPNPKDEYLADGLTEELITRLSQLRELRVIARTSVSQYKSTSKSVSRIGAELNVSSVLEGSVRKERDQLRVTVQLIDVASQEHSWAKTYDRKLESVLAVQVDIAKRVAKRLRVKMRGAEQARLEAKPPVGSDSYLAYLKGRSLMQQVISRDSLEEAKRQFEIAISLDSQNAPAHSGWADATRQLGWYYEEGPRAVWEESAKRYTTRAIQLDPNLAEAHASLGSLLWDDLDYVGAEREFKAALSLNPSYSLGHFWYAVLLEDLNRPEEALRELTLAEGSDPLSSRNLFQLSVLLVWLGRLDEALPKIQKLGQLEPSGRGYHNVLARFYLAQSDLAQSLREMQRVEEATGEPRLKSVMRALYYALAGEAERSRSLLRLEDTLPEFAPTAWIIGWTYAELGDLDECFRWLTKALQNRNLPIQQFRLDPRLGKVRNDPRFTELLEKMNLV